MDKRITEDDKQGQSNIVLYRDYAKPKQTDRKMGGRKRVLSTSERSYWRKIPNNWHREYDLLQSVLASVKKAQ